MINCEGFKAFHGTMKITPVSTDKQPIFITADWLYKPIYNCWYGDGCSFDADVCEVANDESAEKTADEMFGDLDFFKGNPVSDNGEKSTLYEMVGFDGESGEYDYETESPFWIYFGKDEIEIFEEKEQKENFVTIPKSIASALAKKIKELGW